MGANELSLLSKLRATTFASWRSTASPPNRSRHAMARSCSRRAAGPTFSLMQRRQPARRRRSCCMTARRPVRSAGWSSPMSRRSEPRRCPPAPPLPSNGLPGQLDLKNALAVRCDARRPAGRMGDADANFRGYRHTRLSRQGRPHRGSGPDQPRRDRDRLPPPWPSFPAAGPARRRLEAVLAGYAGDRTRTDPAYRVCSPNMPGAG